MMDARKAKTCLGLPIDALQARQRGLVTLLSYARGDAAISLLLFGRSGGAVAAAGSIHTARPGAAINAATGAAAVVAVLEGVDDTAALSRGRRGAARNEVADAVMLVLLVVRAVVVLTTAGPACCARTVVVMRREAEGARGGRGIQRGAGAGAWRQGRLAAAVRGRASGEGLLLVEL